MNSNHNQLPQQPSPETNFPPTPEGFISAVDAAIERHQGAITHVTAEPGDIYGRTGGDKLVLYPNPKDSREAIYIEPVGSNADTRRFYDPHEGTPLYAHNSVQVAYDARHAQGDGLYRTFPGRDGSRTVSGMKLHSEAHLRRAGAFEPAIPTEEQYKDLINALARATTEKPASRTRQMLHRLGNTARKHS